MSIHLISMSSDIVDDLYDEGDGESTGCGYQGEPIGKSFETEALAIAYMADMYNYPSDMHSWEISSSHMESARQVADHSSVQNGGWMEPTESEIEVWENGSFKLYQDQVTVQFLRY